VVQPKQGRDSRFQAILPLARQRSSTIEKTDDAKIYKNTEIQALIHRLGLWHQGGGVQRIGPRYHRIVIMTTPMWDGAHIRTFATHLLLSAIRKLCWEGRLHLHRLPASLPKWSAVKSHYCLQRAGFSSKPTSMVLAARPITQSSVFKGLAKLMPKQLSGKPPWNPTTRTMKRGRD